MVGEGGRVLSLPWGGPRHQLCSQKHMQRAVAPLRPVVVSGWDASGPRHPQLLLSAKRLAVGWGAVRAPRKGGPL